MAVRVFNKVKKIEEDERAAAQVDSNRRQIIKPKTNKDEFQAYCQVQNLEAKRAFMKKMKDEMLEASVTEVEHEEDVEEETVVEAHEEEEEDIEDEVDTIVNVKKKSEDSQLNNLEQLARLGDKSLLLERLEVEEGVEKQAAVEEYVATQCHCRWKGGEGGQRGDKEEDAACSVRLYDLQGRRSQSIEESRSKVLQQGSIEKA